MSKVALVQIGNTQLYVEKDKIYSIPKVNLEVGKKIDINQVLMIKDGDSVVYGRPYIENCIVTVEIISHDKDDKIVSRVYKAKSRYRRTRGFRKRLTKFKVVDIRY
ncbi:MAG: 50S ribosomal protein L21 [Candidatus Dojkabacteria bacterium]|nr:50S ribosomal protein L21 [Candidatus Dojkabacteria bacterium]